MDVNLSSVPQSMAVKAREKLKRAEAAGLSSELLLASVSPYDSEETKVGLSIRSAEIMAG